MIIIGTHGDDILPGTGDADIIAGRAGDDTIDAGAGHDVVDGGRGNDSINGGEGDDALDGGHGNDDLSGGPGMDRMSGGKGDDEMLGGTGDDWLSGGDGDDVLNGGDHSDILDGGDGSDIIYGDQGDEGPDGSANDGGDILRGGNGSDALYGQRGDDTLDGGRGSDLLTGGIGADTFVYDRVSDSPFDRGDEDSWDVIADFEHGIDKIDLRGLTRPGPADDLAWGGTTPTARGVWYEERADGAFIVFVNLDGPEHDHGHGHAHDHGHGHGGNGHHHGHSRIKPDLAIIVHSANGLSAGDFLGVIFDPTNEAPVTTDAVAATDEDTPVAGTVVDNTTDPDNDPLSYAVVGAVPAGLTFNPDGTWSFDPTGNFEHLGDGESAGVSFQYQASDGTDASNVSTVTITIAGINDAPVLDGANALVGIGEDPTTNPGTPVSSLIAGQATDIDGTVQGIAVVATSAAGGQWEYSTDGDAWSTLSASSASALILDASWLVRFVPSLNAQTTSGTVPQTQIAEPALTFHAWDGTTGVAGGTADLSLVGATGGSTAFSSDAATASLAIANVVDSVFTEGADTVDLRALSNDPSTDAVWFEDGNFLDARGGDDNVILSDQASPLFAQYDGQTFLGGDGNDTVTGGDGNDRIDGGTGDDTVVYTAGGGSDIIDGGSDTDTLIVNGSDDPEFYDINPISLGGDSYLGINIGTGSSEPAGELNYETATIGVEAIVVDTGGGADNVIISGDLAGTGVAASTLTLDLAAGDDNVVIMPTEGTPVDLSVDGGEGDDTVDAGTVIGGGPLIAGSEFQVNNVVALDQISPSVTTLTGGRFVVTWTDRSNSEPDVGATEPGIKARLFEADGTPVAGEFTVNTTQSGGQWNPYVASFDGGGFVVVWEDHSGLGGDNQPASIKARVFDADGIEVEPEFLVNDTIQGGQVNPFVAGLPGGGFVVAWEDYSGIGGDAQLSGIKARVFDADSDPVANEFLVNQGTESWQLNAGVAALPGVGFVVVWQDNGDNAPENMFTAPGIKARLYDAAGVALGNAFAVNNTIVGGQINPSVVALEGGGFVVAWEDYSGLGGDGQPSSIKATIFDSSGAAVATEILVNEITASGQASPTIAALVGGGFVVTWMDLSGLDDTSLWGIKARAFDALGNESVSEFLVNERIENTQSAPQVSALAGGGFVVTWTDFSELDADNWLAGIKARIFDSAGEQVGVTNTIVFDGGTGNDTFKSGLADDIFHGGADNDAVIYRVGAGNDIVDGGSETGIAAPDYDTLQVVGDGEDRTITIGSLPQADANNIVPTDGIDSDDVVVSYDGPDGATVRADEIEHIDVVAGDGAVNLVLSDISGTAILPATIRLGGGSGDDTLDLVDFSGGAHVAFDDPDPVTSGDTDLVRLSGRWTDYVAAGSDGSFSIAFKTNPGFALLTTTNVELFYFAGDDQTIDYGELVNQAPDAVDDPAGPVVEDSGPDLASGNVLDNDNDPNSLDAAIVTRIAAGAAPGGSDNVPDGGSIVVAGTYGDLTIHSDGSYSYQLDQARAATEALGVGETAHDLFTYTIADAAGLSDSAHIDISVSGANDAPAAQAQLLATDEDVAVTGTLTATDADSPDLDFAPVGGAVGGTVTAFDAETGDFTFTPAADFSGVASFQFTAGDGIATSAAQTVTIDVAPAADAPTLAFDFTPRPASDEFVTHPSTTSIQQFAAVAALKDGGFVAVWSSEQDGNFRETYARIFDNDGTPIGNEFRVNQFLPYSQTYPTVATLADGDFVISWSSATQEGASPFPDLHSFGVYARRYHPDGTPAGDEFHVNTYTTSAQYVSTVAPLTDGGFVITWSSNGQDGSDFGIYGQYYDGTGAPVGTEFRINDATADDQNYSWTAGLPDGGFVTVWAGQDGSGTGIRARIFDASGTGGSEFQVNSSLLNNQTYPSVAVLANGGFVVSWESVAQDGSGTGMFARRFDADGNPIDTSDIAVNTTTAGDQRLGAVMALPDGGFIVTWVAADTSAMGVFGRRFDADGNPVSGEFLVNQTESGDEVMEAFAVRSPLAMLSSGEFVNVWESNLPGDSNVLARLFSLPGIGEEDAVIALPSISAALTDTDGSETLELRLSDFPDGAEFSAGALDLDSGEWVISDEAEIAALSSTPLTITPPPDYDGAFTLYVDAAVTDTADLSGGETIDTTSLAFDFAVAVISQPDLFI